MGNHEQTKKPKITTIRKPYYKAQDGLWELAYAVQSTKDLELIELLNTARNAVLEFEERLSEKYKWE
jgi:hypothetical protein